MNHVILQKRAKSINFLKIWQVYVGFSKNKGCRNPATALMLLFVKTLRATSLQVGLLKRVLAQSLATQGQVLHVARNLLAEVLVYINLGEVLAEHEAVAA